MTPTEQIREILAKNRMTLKHITDPNPDEVAIPQGVVEDLLGLLDNQRERIILVNCLKGVI